MQNTDLAVPMPILILTSPWPSSTEEILPFICLATFFGKHGPVHIYSLALQHLIPTDTENNQAIPFPQYSSNPD